MIFEGAPCLPKRVLLEVLFSCFCCCSIDCHDRKKLFIEFHIDKRYRFLISSLWQFQTQLQKSALMEDAVQANLVCLAFWLRCLTRHSPRCLDHINLRNIWQNLRKSEKHRKLFIKKIVGHQNVTNLSFSHSSSLILYTPFPTPVFCPGMIFSTRVSSYFDPEKSLLKVWDEFFGEKDQEPFLHINWLVISETNESLGSSDLLRWWKRDPF